MAQERISPEHLKLQQELHENGPPGARRAYGVSGHRWAGAIAAIADRHEVKTILDYGAGQCTLQAALASMTRPIDVDSYDPVTAPDTPLVEHDMVVCTDVLEQVEVEHLDDVIRDLGDLARTCLFIVVAMHEPKKHYEGLNTQDIAYWTKKIDDILSASYHLKYTRDGKRSMKSPGRLIIRGLKQRKEDHA